MALDCRDPSRCPLDTLYPQKLALTSPTSGGRSVGIVCSWTKATALLVIMTFDCLVTKQQWNELLDVLNTACYLPQPDQRENEGNWEAERHKTLIP
jgi:hypothetical protein